MSAGHRVHHVVDLAVVEVGHLAQHRVECTGLFAHRHHLHHHRREDIVACEGRSQRLTFSNRGLHVGNGAFDLALLAVSAAMSRVWRTGTPVRLSTAKVREKRLRDVLWKSFPKIGMRSLMASQA